MRDHGPIDHTRTTDHTNSADDTTKVVLIDDHTMFAEGLAASLRSSAGIEVCALEPTAESGERAVASHQPDVVLVDYGLPDEDGVALAARLHERWPHIRILMVTSLVDERLVLRAVEAGCAGFVTKDRSVDELVATIHAARAGEPLISPIMLGRLLRSIRHRSGAAPRPELTARETEVLQLVCEGLTNPAIAERLVLSHNTVRSHVQNVLSKLQVHSKLEAAIVASRDGLLMRPPGGDT